LIQLGRALALDLIHVECWRPECRCAFIICRAHFRGQRYCSDACRQKARRVSLSTAAKKYKKSLQDCAEQAVRRAAKAKHNAHQAASRARKKMNKVRASDSDRSDSDRKIESEGVAAQPVRAAAPPAVPPEQAITIVARQSRTRTNGAFGTSDTHGQCAICGAHGDIEWVVNVDSGIRRSAWKRFEQQDDP
jgi:hypothetical protein